DTNRRTAPCMTVRLPGVSVDHPLVVAELGDLAEEHLEHPHALTAHVDDRVALLLVEREQQWRDERTPPASDGATVRGQKRQSGLHEVRVEQPVLVLACEDGEAAPLRPDELL